MTERYEGQNRSRAEVLCAMDCLMHHVNDEDWMADWLTDGVPDGMPWHVLDREDSRAGDYPELVEGMTDEEFDAMVRLFARQVKRGCFVTRYESGFFS